MVYRPHYLNVEHIVEEIYLGDRVKPVARNVLAKNTGRKKVVQNARSKKKYEVFNDSDPYDRLDADYEEYLKREENRSNYR
ncbi:TPA: hypothetical protein I0H93_RS14090 [Enterococcus faecalis]|nr:hypothetical protein [Enterococcus faecalis]